MKLKQTRKYLAGLLGMDPRWITKRLKKLGIIHRGALTPIELCMLENDIGNQHQLNNAFKNSD
jgi:hypothetical protein